MSNAKREPRQGCRTKAIYFLDRPTQSEAGKCDECLVQVAYAIGVAQPVGLYVYTYGTMKARNAEGKKLTDGEVATKVQKLVDMRPSAIVKRFGLRNPIYSETAAYGHMGRTPGIKEVNGKKYETFGWEKLDLVDSFRKEFKIVGKEEAVDA